MESVKGAQTYRESIAVVDRQSPFDIFDYILGHFSYWGKILILEIQILNGLIEINCKFWKIANNLWPISTSEWPNFIPCKKTEIQNFQNFFFTIFLNFSLLISCTLA